MHHDYYDYYDYTITARTFYFFGSIVNDKTTHTHRPLKAMIMISMYQIVTHAQLMPWCLLHVGNFRLPLLLHVTNPNPVPTPIPVLKINPGQKCLQCLVIDIEGVRAYRRGERSDRKRL